MNDECRQPRGWRRYWLMVYLPAIRYLLTPSAFSLAILQDLPSVDMNPLMLCFCQDVAFVRSSIVAPVGRRRRH